MPSLVVFLNKIDMVDDEELVELVEMESKYSQDCFSDAAATGADVFINMCMCIGCNDIYYYSTPLSNHVGDKLSKVNEHPVPYYCHIHCTTPCNIHHHQYIYVYVPCLHY